MSVPFCMATTTKGSAVKIVLPRMTFFMSASEGLAVVSALPPPLEDWGCSESENLNLSVVMGGHRVGDFKISFDYWMIVMHAAALYFHLRAKY